MRIQAYTAYPGVLTIALTTPRPEEAASTHFTAAKIHEDYCARVRAVMREWKHIGPTALAYPAAQRLQTYLPVYPEDATGKPLYALRQLMPAGAPRDIDMDYFLEITRLRYAFLLVCLPAYMQADSTDAEGFERHMEYAVTRLFEVLEVPHIAIPGGIVSPGSDDILSEEKTTISITAEMGASSVRQGFEIPQP